VLIIPALGISAVSRATAARISSWRE